MGAGDSGQYQNQEGRPPRGGAKKGGNRTKAGRTRGRKKTPQPTLFQRILSFLTFGRWGAPKAANASSRSQGQGQSPGRSNLEQTGSDSRRSRFSKESPDRDKSADAGSSRPPVTVAVTSPRLYVGNLDYQAHEQDLEDLFRGVGTVASAEIVTNPRTQQSKGFGFVEMSHIDEARRAVDVLHDQDFMGRKLLVTGAKSDGPKDGGDSDDGESAASSREQDANSAAA